MLDEGHDCRMRWEGKSKAMENDFAIDMLVSSTT